MDVLYSKIMSIWGTDGHAKTVYWPFRQGTCRSFIAYAFTIATISACSDAYNPEIIVSSEISNAVKNCAVELIVLGTSQDAGTPQIGNSDDPAWRNPELKAYATSIAVVDHKNEKRYLFEATPDMREQLHLLDNIAPTQDAPSRLGLAGIFLTHAHIGHYAGLIFVGHESAGTNSLPVYAMPHMANYLKSNGPWSQLVDFENIHIAPLQNRRSVPLTSEITVTPYQVPHRDEYSETVGYIIKTTSKSALFLPDIDDWDRWLVEHDINIDEMIKNVDYAFIDATFYDDHELPGRDMSAIPHPRVSDSVVRFTQNIPEHKSKVHFIHVNQTNPIRYRDSPLSLEVVNNGFNIARRGDRHCMKSI